MAIKADLRLYAGDDYNAEVTVRYSDGSDVDLGSYTAQAEIRPSLTDTSSSPVATITTTIHDTNMITLQLTHDQTKILTSGPYVWDLQIIDGTGLITTILAGQVAVTPEVTKIYA